MIKICAGITLYKPNDSDLDNLYQYEEVFEKIYVYDNTPETHREFQNSKIKVISTGKNDGLGVACSELCKAAKNDCYDYIMLFDQDSRISNLDLCRFFTFIDSKEVEAWIYVPQIIYSGKIGENNEKFELVNWCITSGSVIDLKKYGKKYTFDEAYFIDRLDKDICQQILLNGGKICQYNEACLIQKLGELSPKGYSMHQSFRHYYIARNRLYYNKKFSVGKLTTALQTIHHIYSVVRFEDKKTQKIKMIIRGIKDYHKKIMGVMP
ncbi:predicted glycosyltransferase [Clostridium sp. SY8519]|uniref:glycosyltransferase n=1 Tax=Clostridium sp. (strain SY8519) TaxID=1042156 RepID=UPI00021722D0|nr:glycosyltransferase [Clostridium sp. SY8519]BAK48510.1 predicted glycosyltransferase [Clostridium sp. SY8519]